MNSIAVGGARPYAIRIGGGLLGDANGLLAPLRGRHALVVSDAHVAPLYAARVVAALRSRDATVVGECVLPAGEGESWVQSPLLGLITGESVQDSVRARTRTPQPLACDGMLEW